MIENTSGLFPEGDFIMEVSDVPNKSERKGFIFWDFQFSTVLDEQLTTYSEAIPIWLCAPMFKVLGYPEVRPGSFDVDPPAALGKRIRCKIIHEVVKEVPRARMKEMSLVTDVPKKSNIPF